MRILVNIATGAGMRRLAPRVLLTAALLSCLGFDCPPARAAELTEQDFAGTYMLTIVDARNAAPTTWLCAINAGSIIIDRKKWGTWEIDDDHVLVTSLPPNTGQVKLKKKGRDGFVGQHTLDGKVLKWSLQRVYVVAWWEHQAGNMKPVELPFWSTGTVGEPDGRVKWSINPQKRELVLTWPETTDRCRLSPDGSRYEGRNEHGTLITGKLIRSP